MHGSESKPEPERLAIPFVKAIVLSPDRSQFLLQRRVKEDPYHGFWELPGGRMRMGETVEDCLRREVHEEAGIRIRSVLGQTGEQITDRFGRTARRVRPLVTVEVAGAGALAGPGIVGNYFACLADGDPHPTEEGGEHRLLTPAAFAAEFLDPGGAGGCATLDLLAMRIILAEKKLEPFLKVL